MILFRMCVQRFVTLSKTLLHVNLVLQLWKVSIAVFVSHRDFFLTPHMCALSPHPSPISLSSVFTGCPYGPDPVWNITWPNTLTGTTSIQPCPGGVDSVGQSLTNLRRACCVSLQSVYSCIVYHLYTGNATRMCYENGTWADPDVLQCLSLNILRVSMEVCLFDFAVALEAGCTSAKDIAQLLLL